jgi:iron-sulfur cluster repair protein YtfE (RIC family)
MELVKAHWVPIGPGGSKTKEVEAMLRTLLYRYIIEHIIETYNLHRRVLKTLIDLPRVLHRVLRRVVRRA